MIAKTQKRVLTAVVIAVAAASGWAGQTLISAQQGNAGFNAALVEAMRANCEQRLDLTRQYRVRGIDLELLAKTMIEHTHNTIQAIRVAVPPDKGGRERIAGYRRTLPKLERVVDEVQVLPLENCERRAEELEEELPPG